MKGRLGRLPKEPAEANDLEEPAMGGVGGQPREVVVRVPEALTLRGVILGLLPGGVTLELADRRPLFERLDVRYQQVLRHAGSLT